jgi:hypothetical protein
LNSTNGSFILHHMTGPVRCLALFGVLLIVPAIGHAAPAGRSDPDWPCQQIKVPDVSLPAIWSGPDVDPRQSEWKNDPAVVELVQRLAPRREPIERAQALIRDFAHGSDKTKLLQVLVGLFTTLGEERASVLAGLDRFGRRQKELAAQVRADNEKLRGLQSDPVADANAVTQATQQVTWEAEVYQDRRQAIAYACGVPAKIEQRLFALAKTIQDAVQ